MRNRVKHNFQLVNKFLETFCTNFRNFVFSWTQEVKDYSCVWRKETDFSQVLTLITGAQAPLGHPKKLWNLFFQLFFFKKLVWVQRKYASKLSTLFQGNFHSKLMLDFWLLNVVFTSIIKAQFKDSRNLKFLKNIISKLEVKEFFWSLRF